MVLNVVILFFVVIVMLVEVCMLSVEKLRFVVLELFCSVVVLLFFLKLLVCRLVYVSLMNGLSVMLWNVVE